MVEECGSFAVVAMGRIGRDHPKCALLRIAQLPPDGMMSKLGTRYSSTPHVAKANGATQMLSRVVDSSSKDGSRGVEGDNSIPPCLW